jgi:hypothetical protein
MYWNDGRNSNTHDPQKINGQSSFNKTNGNSVGRKASANARLGGAGIGGVAMAGVDTIMNLKSGDDLGTAGVKAAASAILWTAAPWTMGIAEVASAVPGVVGAANQWGKKKTDWWNTQHLQGNVGGQYQDTQRAFTMRQAAVNQIQSSKMNARSALGGEAQILNRNHHRA